VHFEDGIGAWPYLDSLRVKRKSEAALAESVNYLLEAEEAFSLSVAGLRKPMPYQAIPSQKVGLIHFRSPAIFPVAIPGLASIVAHP
jgi:hypothetical protein